MKYIFIPSTFYTFEHGQPVLFFSEASECQQPGGALSGREDGPSHRWIKSMIFKPSLAAFLGIPH